MPSPRHSRSSNRHGPARDLELSNSTTARFLGSMPKAWMTGQTPLESGFVQGTSPTARPGQRQSSTTIRSTQSAVTARSVTYQASPTNTPSSPNLPIAAQSAGLEQQSLANRKSPEFENVLPSPAPSDEHHQGSTCMVDMDQEQSLANDSSNEPNSDARRELAKRYDGAEDIEKRFNSIGNHASVPSNPSPASTSDAAHGISGARTGKRPLDRPPDGPRKVHSRQRTDSSNAMRASVNQQSVPEVTLQHFSQILQRTNFARNSQSRQGKIAGSRLSLLQDALKASDYSYLILHQIYCMYSRSQQTVWKSCRGFQVSHSLGLKSLSFLLVDNSVLENEAVKWFSTFPLPMELILQQYPVFQAAYTYILYFLEKFHQHWVRMQEESRLRNCPPSANEMTLILGLDSIVLQGVLYRAIHHDTWTGEYDQCYRNGEAAFFRAQREAQGKQNFSLDQGLRERQNQAFILETQQLWRHHTTHCLSQVPPPVNQRAALTMQIAPPQNPQSTMPTSSSSGGRRSSATSRPPLSVNAIAAQRHGSWTMYTPVVPSSSAQKSPVSHASSPKTVQASPESFNSQTQRTLPATPQVTPQATSNIQRISVIRPLHSPSASGMTQQSLQCSPSQGTLSTSSSPGTRNPNIPMQNFGAPRPSSPHPLSVIQSTWPRQSIPMAISGMNSFPPSSNAAAQALSPAQAPLPHASHDRPAFFNAGNVYATPYQSPSAGHAIASPAPSIFLGPVDQSSQAPTALSTVHQAHLQSPILEVRTLNGMLDPITKYFTYIKDVAILPQRLHGQKRHLTWSWDEAREDGQPLASCTLPQDGSPARMSVSIGARMCRLRCIKLEGGKDSPTESDWVAAEHTWPDYIAIILNGKGLELRKKLHQGKNMPVNITSSIKEGRNSVSIALSQLAPDDHSVYAFGLENIHVTNARIIKSEIKTVSCLEAREDIRRTFGLGDPDVQVLDPSITLDVTDPYSSSLCCIPVRSTLCRHHQCFDLDIFLSTRSSKTPTEPCEPDQFRCPICKVDARPKNLFIDGFLMKIREELEQLKRLDAKFIVIDEIGKWSIKEVETTGEPGDGTGARKSMSVGPRAGPNEVPSGIIELDDDD